MATYKEDTILALKNLGGAAHLSKIIEYTRIFTDDFIKNNIYLDDKKVLKKIF